MSLGTPWMLLLLAPVALAGWLTARGRRLQRDAACRLKGVGPNGGPARLDRREWLALAALGCTVLALARPQWSPRLHETQRRGRDLVIALDVSRSMLAADVYPNRLEAARIAIHEALPALAGQRIGLIVFAGSAAVRVPLTLDHEFVRYMLDRADPSDVDLGSTSLQAAFQKAVGVVLSDAAGGRRDLVVFTDGEDHLSDIRKTAEMLAECGARVLIVGLGDPVQGACVPDASGATQWMRHNDAVVVSRLDEGTLTQLSGKSSNVTYYPARTRPFDLVPLYESATSGATAEVVVGELRQVRYTEGYPYLLGLSVGLWLASLPLGSPAARHLLAFLLLLPGCGRTDGEQDSAVFRTTCQRADALLQHAREQSPVDLSAARGLLVSAREAFLRAALLRPGDVEIARHITGVTRRLREVDAALGKQHAEEKKRREELAELIAQLQKLTGRQARLSQQSSQLLRRRLVSPQADFSQSSDKDNEDIATEDGKMSGGRLARPAATEQQAVREGTAHVLDAVTFHQKALRQLLARAYGETGKESVTELDPVVDLLAGAVAAQQQALNNLVPEAVQWPQVNSAFHTASGRMRQALDTLRSLQPPSKDQDDRAPPSRNDAGYDEDLERPDFDAKGNQAQSASPGDFTAALSLRSLPAPNYTPAEILAEESANQQRRAKQKAARAGAKVEKNW